MAVNDQTDDWLKEAINILNDADDDVECVRCHEMSSKANCEKTVDGYVCESCGKKSIEEGFSDRSYTMKQLEEIIKLCKQYGLETTAQVDRLCSEIGIKDALIALRKYSRKVGQDFSLDEKLVDTDALVDKALAN